MTILDPSLRDALRTLKLTGMLETLDARLAQTRAGTLGHLEFLQVLCEDEIGRRPTAPAATPTAPGAHGSANTPARPSSSSTTTPSESTPPPRPTTSTSSSRIAQ